MALRKVVEEGDSVLRKRAREIEQVDERIRILAADMAETMEASNGVGIAAPQVGVLRRMFLAVTDAEGADFPRVYINPEILESEGIQEGEEGCLSVPGYVGTVSRPQKIRLKSMDLDGNWMEEDYEDFAAVVICHELDHLNGVLYIDKAADIRPAGEPPEDGESL